MKTVSELGVVAYTPLLLASGRWRQGDACQFKASLDYGGGFLESQRYKPERPCLKTNQQNQNKTVSVWSV